MAETKCWLRRMSVIGGALGPSSVLSCLARPSGPKDKRFTVSMPTCIEEPGAPVAAVYYYNWGRCPPVSGPQVIIAVYRDRRIIWSGDSLRGGPPYRIGKVGRLQVQKVLDELDRSGHFTDPVRNECRVPPDAPYTVIAIASGTRRLWMGSSHELTEARPGAVATASSIGSLGGRDRAQVLAAQPESYRHFRQVWGHVWAAIASMIPAGGKDAGNLEFQLKSISAVAPGD